VRQSAKTGLETSSSRARSPAAQASDHGVAGAELGEPQAGAGLQQQRPGQHPGRRIALLSRRRQRGLRLVGLVEPDERVHEERQRPEDRRRPCNAELGLERDAGVGLGVPDLSAPQAGERPEHAAVRERDQPPARSRDVDDPLVAFPCRFEVVAEDQAQRRGRAEERLRLPVEHVVGE
jgi:hypothetical protein